MNYGNCRFCGAPLQHSFVDLGSSPLANSYLDERQMQAMEPFYPLHVFVCNECLLVQLLEYEAAEHIFSDYAYFSSYSETLLKHSESYVDMMVRRFGLNPDNLVVEIASNDGYLLQYFIQRNIPVLGVEPAQNVAEAAIAAGVPTIKKFFDTDTARELTSSGQNADLIIGNNVLAHVPKLNDFVEGMKNLLKPQGIITIEFPHLVCLFEGNQFDTIYHEHFSYFSFGTVERIFDAHGLTLFDVDEIPTHGGSLRIYARHHSDTTKPVSEAVKELRDREKKAGFTTLKHYFLFEERVKETKRKILDFMVKVKREKKSMAGYGAPAKGNTLLNYCAIRTDFLDYTVDRSPHKQGRYLPGTRIPILHPERIRETRPDYVIILAWNLKDEIMSQMEYVRSWGGRFVTLIPDVVVH